MSDTPPDSIQQTAQNVRKHVIQAGRDYTVTSTFNINVLISVFFISILALGGIAWALGLSGQHQGDLTPQFPEITPQTDTPQE